MKLWGGRFASGTDRAAESFHSSIGFDQRLYAQDIRGSIAHAAMLANCGIISAEEAQQLIDGLKGILADIEAGHVEFDVAAEDIHMNVEKLLTERVGAVGGKLHTARSRNDQVAVDTRMWLREQIDAIIDQLNALLTGLLDMAEREKDTVMPGYTHLQKAQPLTLAHHLLAYFQMFSRDVTRLEDCRARMNYSPLGSCALAGSTFPIDRAQTAAELGFDGYTLNSMDGVSDRDFAIEFLAAASLIMMHMSRFCEELILWSSSEFGFVLISDAYSTGSSIMPQKKNPDMAELTRGKTGRVYGDLIALLTVMKGLPLAYNKDMQEDKEPLFDAVDTVIGCLSIFTPMLLTATFRKEKMRHAAEGGGFINATDMADYLAARGLPFRQAHEVVGKLVLVAERQGKQLMDLTMDELHEACPLFDESIYVALTAESCVAARRSAGGPAPAAVEAQIRAGRDFLAARQK
ncbi:MAG: argininosuccinate lyase [Firmicutes bacterium]|nr:argininosuccinate lyase [Bacillota bacterium]